MTAQIRTEFYFNGTRYFLIDSEFDKYLLDQTVFTIPIDFDHEGVCTANWKGYYVTYFLENRSLYGVLHEFLNDEDMKHKIIAYSQQKELAYTGTCIIGKTINDRRKNSGYFCDYYANFVEEDYAYELSFEKGYLVGLNNLDKCIEEYGKEKCEPALLDKFLHGRYGKHTKEAEFEKVINSNATNNMDEHIRLILGLRKNSLFKYQDGLNHSFSVGAMAGEYLMEEDVEYLDIKIMDKEKNVTRVTLSCAEQTGRGKLICEVSDEDGCFVEYDSEKLKGFLRALQDTEIFEDVGNIITVREGEFIAWYIDVRYKDNGQECLNGVNRLPEKWDDLLNVLEKLKK